MVQSSNGKTDYIFNVVRGQPSFRRIKWNTNILRVRFPLALLMFEKRFGY
jgi:hypothetical protein